MKLGGSISKTMNTVIRSTRESRNIWFSKLNTKQNYAAVEKAIL